PTPQPYPDAAATSASNYYPTSNWASDYNYYNVPGGSNYGYNWYGGWNPWNRVGVYNTYAYNGGRSWTGGWWRGGGWTSGWNRGGGYGWGGGWSGSHRNWNYSHGDRYSHSGYGDHHG